MANKRIYGVFTHVMISNRLLKVSCGILNQFESRSDSN